jgi:hypothetical protein
MPQERLVIPNRPGIGLASVRFDFTGLGNSCWTTPTPLGSRCSALRVRQKWGNSRQAGPDLVTVWPLLGQEGGRPVV